MSKTYNAVDEIKQQPDLFGGMLTSPSFPSTRYQGSKYKILEWIDCYTRGLDFHSVLDAFGGTACVSYMLSLIHISEPRDRQKSRMPSSA